MYTYFRWEIEFYEWSRTIDNTENFTLANCP